MGVINLFSLAFNHLKLRVYRISGRPIHSRNRRENWPVQWPMFHFSTIWLWLTVRHGKIHHAIKNGKPSISMSHGLTMAMWNNQVLLWSSWIISSYLPSRSQLSHRTFAAAAMLRNWTEATWRRGVDIDAWHNQLHIIWDLPIKMVIFHNYVIYIYGWWFEPLCKIWVRQLGWWHSQYMYG